MKGKEAYLIFGLVLSLFGAYVIHLERIGNFTVGRIYNGTEAVGVGVGFLLIGFCSLCYYCFPLLKKRFVINQIIFLFLLYACFIAFPIVLWVLDYQLEYHRFFFLLSLGISIIVAHFVVHKSAVQVWCNNPSEIVQEDSVG